MRNWIALAATLLVVVLAPSLTLAAAPEIVLEQPNDRSVVRGEPALVSVVVAADSPAIVMRVEVDGQVRAPLWPWSRNHAIELEPGLHRLAVVGRDPNSGMPLRSQTVQVAVFGEAPTTPADPRRRNAVTALLAFVIAIAGATTLRRRRGRE